MPEAVLSDSLRAPRLSVLANGAELPGVIEADVRANNFFSADRFRVRLAASVVAPDVLSDPAQVFDVRVSLGGGFFSLIQGAADTVVLDPIQGTIEVEGRDLSAGLLESPTQETFANRTASEIAEILAARHGLAPEVTATSTLVGRYYQSERDRLTLNQFSRVTTEWDLLVFLAGQERFDVFVSGQSLIFAPPSGVDVVALRPADCVSLHCEHALSLSREIEVTVRSWSTRNSAAVTQVARGGAGRGRALVRPNLAPDEAQLLAARVVADLARHERIVHATLPGELSMTPRTAVALSGTNSGFDQVYAVAEVSRHLDVRHGFVQRLHLQSRAGA